MLWNSLVALALAAPSAALIRFQCAQLVTERLDPLVEPGVAPSGHLHQIVGGNMFNASMPPADRLPDNATCTSCQFTADFSNYWTAVLFFKARNGTYHRVPQLPNAGFEGVAGGMTVYYMNDGLADYKQVSKVKAFQPGFRMIIGSPGYTTREQANKYRQLTYTCLENVGTRFPETMDFPKKACTYGIMSNLRFPTCWDGKNLDSPDHMAHMSYPEVGTFESRGPCPATHPVRVSQVMYEVIWDTSKFNNKEDWPEDGSQPFVWSTSERTGYGTHGDYLFGWRDNSLQDVLDSSCYVNCPVLKTQSVADMNKCTIGKTVNENIDGWLTELPGRPHM